MRVQDGPDLRGRGGGIVVVQHQSQLHADRAIDPGQGIALQCAIELHQRGLELADSFQELSVLVQGFRIAGGQRQCAAECAVGMRPAHLIHVHHALRDVRQRDVRIRRERAPRGFQRIRVGGLHRGRPVRRQQCLRFGQCGPRLRVIRIDRHGLPERAHRFAHRARRQQRKATQIEIVCARINCLLRHQRGCTATGQLHLQLVGNRLGDFILDREDAGELAVVFFRPQVIAAAGVDQLRGDAHLVAGLLHAAFQHRRDIQHFARPCAGPRLCL